MKLITIFLIISLLLFSSCGLTGEDCRNIALEEANDWRKLGYSEGLFKGIDSCEKDYKRILKQYQPDEKCMILLIDGMTKKYICEGDPFYKELGGYERDFTYLNKIKQREEAD